MKDNIRFKGLTLDRDEMLATHGETALCGGVEVHDGSLRPSVLDGTDLADGQPLQLGEVLQLVYVHQTEDYTHYLAVYNDGLFAYREDGQGWHNLHSGVIDGDYDASCMKSITSIGNTLCIMNTDNLQGQNGGLHYFLCYNDNGDWKYKYLGQQPPFLNIQFGLHRGDVDENLKEYFDYKMQEGDFFDPEDDTHTKIAETQRATLTEHVLGNVNKRIDDILGDGRFYAPFLIRYCYRMYDGSMIMHSAPVLMMPMLHHPAMTWCYSISNFMQPILDGNLRTVRWCLFMRSCKLQAKAINASIITELSDWSDIIRSVDVFITPQFSRIDTSKMIEKADVVYQENNYAIWGVGALYGTEQDESSNFAQTYSNATALIFPSGFGTGASIVLPEYSETEYFSRIRRASYFYKLCSIELQDIGTSNTKKLCGSVKDLAFDASILRNIAVQKQMTDDYKTHNIILPGTDKAGIYTYNHRLNCYGISERLFKGFIATIMFPIMEAVTADNYKIRVYIKTDSGIFAVECANGVLPNLSLYNNFLLKNGYIFYPDSRAFAMVIYKNDVPILRRRLTESDELNASLSFCDDGEVGSLPDFVNNLNGAVSNKLAIVPMLNKIYTSKIDNPFYFPNLPEESGINTVGVGQIYGLAVPKRSLTADMAGFSDLLIFSTDGIWVAKVSSTGTYSEKHNISSEICINKKSICQLDQSVVFATSRSLSRIVSQDISSLTDVLDGPYFNVKKQLTELTNYLCDDEAETYDADADELITFNGEVAGVTFTPIPPLEYYQSGKVVYDYIKSRLIVLPGDTTDRSVALVFSIRDAAWSTMLLPPIRAVVDGYPSPYIQYDVDADNDGDIEYEGVVMRLDKAYDYADNVAHTGVVVTRTLSYSDTMDLVRGFRQLTNCASMPLLFFFGSNDQRSWQYIGRSERSFHNYMPGHPFRFFRVAIYMKILTSEKYQELILEIVNKYAKL